MWTKSKLLQMVVVLFAAGEVHNLKCRTVEHSRRQGDFIDIAKQCNNMTTDERSSGSTLVDSDYSSSSTGQKYNQNYNGDRRDKTSSNYNNNRRTDEDGQRNKNGWRNNDREFNVRRQDFGNNNNRGSNDNNSDRGSGGDRDSSSCEVRPQQYSVNRQDYNTENNNGDRSKNQGYRPGNSYNPSFDYDARQSNSNNRQHQTRRHRRDANNNYNRIKSATASGNGRLLGNNRFRNITKNDGNQAKGSILDKIDACTIHCVFNELDMLNSNSRPDKTSIVNLMTNQIKDVELKEFIQDSIDECFDTLELETHNTKCEFSKNFAVCMENKAQRNCDDWDENMQSTNKMNSAQESNHQQDKRKGY